MTAQLVYVLDANVFIEAKRRYYAFGICPGFWDCLVWHNAQERLCSIDRIKDELVGEGDDLSKWVTDQVPASAFRASDETDVIGWYGQMVAWVQAEAQYKPEAKAEFARKADAWLIAYAKANDVTLVTHEVLSEMARRKVPIPNVCREFGVRWVDSFKMLGELGASFSWHPPR